MAAIMAVAGFSATPAEGVPNTNWFRFINNCSGDNFKCDYTGLKCWCEMVWDDPSFWQACYGISATNCADEDPPVSYPNEFREHAKIEFSTTDSRCNADGESRHGDLCSSDEDCAVCDGGTRDGISCAGGGAARCTGGGGTCEDGSCKQEGYLKVILTTDSSSEDITLNDLTLLPESGGSDHLSVKFDSEDALGNLLNLFVLYLDSTNGDVTVTVEEDTELKTDTTN